MDAIIAWAGSLTVGQTVILTCVVLALLLLAVIGLTSLILPFWVAALGWLAAAGVFFGLVLFLPVDTDGLRAEADPAPDHAAALARFEAWRDAAEAPLNPLCQPRLLTHGERTPTAVVLIHGVSSCPQAFVEFAPILHERGHNVLVVRMPQNGHADRATDALRRLTAEQLADMADTAVDIAAGLGEEVAVLGISAGGTAAAWAGQNRPEVRRTVLVAPFFGLGSFGVRINLAIMRATLVLPHISIWKDPILRERYGGMPHAYKRQSTRATGEIMRLGLATYRQARGYAAGTQEAGIITNSADNAVDNTVTDAFLNAWRAQGLPILTYDFDIDHGLGHELIDPMEPGADPPLTYPVIISILEGGKPPGSAVENGAAAALTR